MADVITRFKLETTQFDSKLRDSSKAIRDIAHQAELGGKGFKDFSQKSIEAARSLGQVASGATNTKDKVKDLVGAYNEAAKAYNSLTKEQQQSDFGKALANSISQLKTRITEAKQELYGLGDAMKSAGGGGLFGGDNLKGMLQVFGGNLMTKGAAMVASFANEMGEAVKQGIELARQGEGIRNAFERLGRGDIMQGLREATHGTVTDIELMKAAVKFNDFKLPLDELGTMLAFAQQKAKDTGQSVDYMVDSIVTGLGRKSLMILDNLGLSANEVKEKMKETGDMTKAVGAIIREQMSKAGDYVETAADRATKADVELKNAMEELGRTFQPLTDASNGLWNSIKVGALNALNSAVRPLIDALTEAGRIRSQYESQGGNKRVNRQLDFLRGISTKEYRQGTYKAQLRNYDTKISSYEQYLQDYKKWQSDKTSVGAYDRMQAFQKQTGLSMYSDVKEQLEVFKKMRAEYVMGAKSIIADNPAPSPTSPTATTKTTGGGGKQTTAKELTELQSNQQRINELTQEYVNISDQSTDAVKNRQTEIQKEIALLQHRNNTLKLYAEQAQGKLLGGDANKTDLSGSQFRGFAAASLDVGAGLSPKVIGEINNSLTSQISILNQQQKAYGMAAQAAQNFGSAMAGIEDPAAKAAGQVTQAIASIALGFAMASSNANTAGTGWGWLAWLAAGMGAMATTIATIHSLTGYANGGEIKGNSYSGDNLMAMGPDGGLIGLNAGEIVLNKAQSANLATSLQQGGGGATRIVGVLKGEDIVLMADRWGMRTGRGELLFGKNL
jgi:hypothetical protein